MENMTVADRIALYEQITGERVDSTERTFHLATAELVQPGRKVSDRQAQFDRYAALWGQR